MYIDKNIYKYLKELHDEAAFYLKSSQFDDNLTSATGIVGYSWGTLR